MARRSSMNDSALAEKQLLELEALLDKRSDNPNTLLRAQSAFASLWRPAQPNTQATRVALEDSPAAPSAPRPRRTAYLDGLKGFAALLVYSLHHEIWAHVGVGADKVLENSFGFDNRYHFVCLPVVRIFFSGGHLAVALFFIISGYVLSAKPLSLIHSKETSLLADNLGSALFRRWLRLFLPVIATTFIWMTCWHLLRIRSSSIVTDAPEKTYGAELWKWYCDFKNFSFVFGSTDSWNHYNDHLWSIPLEFKGSIAVYTTLLSVARCSTNMRLLIEGALIWYFLYIVDGWFCALFIMGMLLCDIDLLANARRLPAPLRRLYNPPNWVFYLLLAIGLYFGGVPSHSNDIAHLRRSPGWYWLSALKPQAVYDFRWFYRFVAATLMMISIPRIPLLKKFFESSFCQYLGANCFSLYLVHGPVLWSMGDRIYAATGRVQAGPTSFVPGWINLFPFPAWGPLGLEINYLVPHLILLPVTLLLAECVTKFFDEPSLTFSKWIFNQATDSDRDNGRILDRKSSIST